MHKLTAYLGIACVVLFVLSFLVFSRLTPEFDMVHDYISLLGAKGRSLALWWNLIGFVCVGVVFSLFGWAAGILAVLPMVGTALGLFTAPVSHRLILGIVFGWVVFAAVRFLSRPRVQ